MPTHSYIHSIETEKNHRELWPGVTQHPACTKIYYIYCGGPFTSLVTGNCGWWTGLSPHAESQDQCNICTCMWNSEKSRTFSRPILLYLQTSITTYFLNYSAYFQKFFFIIPQSSQFLFLVSIPGKQYFIEVTIFLNQKYNFLT